MPAQKIEAFSLDVDGVEIDVPSKEYVNKAWDAKIKKVMLDDIPIIIGTTNINDPRYQINRMIQAYPEGSIFLINELNSSVISFNDLNYVPVGYFAYHHKPFYQDDTKGLCIYSAIIVRNFLVEHITEKKVPGPFTSIYLKYNSIFKDIVLH